MKRIYYIIFVGILLVGFILISLILIEGIQFLKHITTEILEGIKEFLPP